MLGYGVPVFRIPTSPAQFPPHLKHQILSLKVLPLLSYFKQNSYKSYILRHIKKTCSALPVSSVSGNQWLHKQWTSRRIPSQVWRISLQPISLVYFVIQRTNRYCDKPASVLSSVCTHTRCRSALNPWSIEAASHLCPWLDFDLMHSTKAFQDNTNPGPEQNSTPSGSHSLPCNYIACPILVVWLSPICVRVSKSNWIIHLMLQVHNLQYRSFR